MQNKIDSNLSFMARIEPFIKISNPKRFAAINELFKAGTRKYSKDTLYLSKPEGRNVLSVHLMKKNVNGKDFTVDTDEIITASLDEHMNYMTDEQIADKLIAFFKLLLGAKKARISLNSVENEIHKAKKLLTWYKGKVESLEESPNVDILRMYKALMERKYDTLEKLTQKKSTSFKEFRAQQQMLAEKYPEVREIDVI